MARGNKNATATPIESRKVTLLITYNRVPLLKALTSFTLMSEKTSAAMVKTVVTRTATNMQMLKLQLIANGTLPATEVPKVFSSSQYVGGTEQTSFACKSSRSAKDMDASPECRLSLW